MRVTTSTAAAALRGVQQRPTRASASLPQNSQARDSSNYAAKMSKYSKRVSMDYSQIVNEGAVLRNRLSEIEDDDDEAPLAPRSSKAAVSMKQNPGSLPLTNALSSRVSSNDRNLEKTLTNIKTMSLMFESGALQLPAAARPQSFNSIDTAADSAPRGLMVLEAPPPRNSSSAQRTRMSEDSNPRFVNDSPTLSSTPPPAADNDYVRGLELRVEQLEAMLATMQQRLGSVLDSHEYAKIPSKHDAAPRQHAQQPSRNALLNAQDRSVETAVAGQGPDSSASMVAGDSRQPNSDRSAPSAPSTQRSGRRLSIQGVAQGIMFARRLHLPAIGQLPVFDKAACSKGIMLQNMNTLATLMQFSNTPHPYCLGPVITRGPSMLNITLYFGAPALPAINDALSSADLQSVLNSGSTDDIVHAVISSPPDALSQALKSTDPNTLIALSKQFGVNIRAGKAFESRCEEFRGRCGEIARDAANAGVCFFGVCGASAPTHGIRGDEMVWCSSINERKDPGTPKFKPLLGKEARIAAREVHIKLLLADLSVICDAIPECGAFLNEFIPRRRTDVEDNPSYQQLPNRWNDFGEKQLFDVFLGPKAIPKTFPTWPENLMNIFVLRGDMTADSNDLDQALEKIHYQQQTLADKLEKQPLNRRKATLTPRFDEENKPGIPLLPVLKEITIRQDGISLSQPPKVLMQPPRANGFDFQTPLMSEDGHLILPGDDSRPGSVFNSRHSSSQQMSPRQPNIDLGLFQGPAALVHFRMRTKDEMVALCGGDDKFFPLHPSIGTSRQNQQYSDSNTRKAKKTNMHPVFTATEVATTFDKDDMGNVDGLKSFVEGTLLQMRSILQDLRDLSEQPGQLFLLNDTFIMDNFMLEMNSNYLPRSEALEVNPTKSPISISISLTVDIKDRADKVVLAANQFYNVRLTGENTFKLLAQNGSHVTALKDISQDHAVKLGLTIASVKRVTHLSRTSTKTGKTQELPSVVIPWMPGQSDQFAERRLLGCSTFGPGSIVTIKLDGPRKRLWLCNGVSGSGNIHGIPSENDTDSRMFQIDFAVLRPFVAFSSKFQNVQVMPELPPVITDVHKKTMSLEARLSDLTSEFSQLGGSDSLIIYGFSSSFLECSGGDDAEPNIEAAQRKLVKRFETYSGISSHYNYLNFKIFNLFVKKTESVEQVCKVEFASDDEMREAARLQQEDPRFQVHPRLKVELEDIRRDADSSFVDYNISEESEQSNVIIFRPTGAVTHPAQLIEQYCARLGLRYEPLDDSLASDPGRKSFKMCNRRLAQVFFNDLDAADAANEEFQEMASGEDATAFHKAFIAEFYVRSELETAESARQNWMKFKENAKNIVLAHNLLQEHYSDCMSATHYADAFAPILSRAKKLLDCSLLVVKGLCVHMHDLHN